MTDFVCFEGSPVKLRKGLFLLVCLKEFEENGNEIPVNISLKAILSTSM